eukprot:TRINITY_DN36889_c0_g1_i1.p7 TRINITY_DN36889_c0_g1~~TRINITY_DN36889_c0_g1_i1.p7  ORF type:complete len:161 (+),score=9.71 TRINITY_DN36889_c0_g1_i1:1324-1806(+)
MYKMAGNIFRLICYLCGVQRITPSSIFDLMMGIYVCIVCEISLDLVKYGCVKKKFKMREQFWDRTINLLRLLFLQIQLRILLFVLKKVRTIQRLKLVLSKIVLKKNDPSTFYEDGLKKKNDPSTFYEDGLKMRTAFFEDDQKTRELKLNNLFSTKINSFQ